MRSWFFKACLILLVLMIAGLASCAPRPPAAVLPAHTAVLAAASDVNLRAETQANCLEGAWAVTNLQQMMYESYLQSQSEFGLERITGRAGYRFDDQGQMTITFDSLTAILTGEIDGQPMQVQQVIDGAASTRYSQDRTNSRLMLTNFSGEGITIGLEINGQRLVEGNFPVWRAFTSEPVEEAGKPTTLVEYAQVQVDCRGDSLSIQAFEPLPGPVIFLQRVK